MALPDTYVREETDAGPDREFWIAKVGPVRHTFEFQDDGDAIGLALWSEVLEGEPEWDSHVVVRVTNNDVQKMIACLLLLCGRSGGTGCGFCHDSHPRWLLSIDTDVPLDLADDPRVRFVWSDGGRWKACDLCAGYIEQGNVPALVNRTVGAEQAANHPMALTRQGRADLCLIYAEQYGALLAYRFVKQLLSEADH
ncbi:hypothetical protein [Streptomyces sp. MBT62]|uniref:hypothetical protein n=1 Tax=Streptomyces sp. MBT62 TaxID=2800410 RepID=UPI00190C7A01|nr:hypothetical protein [Streptomyces sp. MBT62]MBK3564456.1 hypothetical protein [Streptomyces sp. MBT62]